MNHLRIFTIGVVSITLCYCLNEVLQKNTQQAYASISPRASTPPRTGTAPFGTSAVSMPLSGGDIAIVWNVLGIADFDQDGFDDVLAEVGPSNVQVRTLDVLLNQSGAGFTSGHLY